jgi:hypothetical protein
MANGAYVMAASFSSSASDSLYPRRIKQGLLHRDFQEYRISLEGEQGIARDAKYPTQHRLRPCYPRPWRFLGLPIPGVHHEHALRNGGRRPAPRTQRQTLVLSYTHRDLAMFGHDCITFDVLHLTYVSNQVSDVTNVQFPLPFSKMFVACIICKFLR